MTPDTPDSVSVGALPPPFPPPEADDLSSHAHRQVIGGFGLVLPFLLWLIAGMRHTQGRQQWKVLSSVSAYYYTGAVAAFVGILIALAVFLFTYRGYKNEHRRVDRVAAIVAGGAAVLVAFFPTRAPGDLPVPSWWTPQTGTIHNIAAVVLFGAFIFFSLILFPKSKVKPGEPRPRDKQVRNRIYIVCGVGIAFCMLWAGIASFKGAPIFLPEACALEFFAVSWLVKGRADRTAVRTLYYGSRPRELAGKVWSGIRS